MGNVIFPPRPGFSVMPSELPRLERTGRYIWQPKYQGSRICVNISPRGDVCSCDRHGGTHKRFILSDAQKKEILSLPGLRLGLEYWLDGEVLIKTKPKDTRGKIVFFDILQAGKYLFGKPDQLTRLALLDELCGNPSQIDPWRGIFHQVSDSLMLAPYSDAGFAAAFQKYSPFDETEGLVLRERNSCIDSYGRREYERSWLIRCRRPAKNYAF